MGVFGHDQLAVPGRVELAHEPPFTLGRLRVHPPTRQIARDGVSETLEPRVMQVLVALFRARGEVVTRDQLIDSCWDGRIVGENAIHRVISRIREIASGPDSGFSVETITKVGYRIVSGTAPLGHSRTAVPIGPGEPRIDRRHLLAGAGALAVAGVGGTWIWRRSATGHSSGGTDSAIAQDLYRRGVNAQRQGLDEQNRQATAFFRQATEVEPNYADAWGALALAYRHMMESDAGGRLESLAQWSRSAANRALALDPSNADARVALLTTKPFYRNWGAYERDCSAAIGHGLDHWLLHGILGRVAGEVGHWKQSIDRLHEVNAMDPFLPLGRGWLGYALWNDGQLQQAESELDKALERWPGHPLVWTVKFEFLAFNGKTAGAIAMTDDKQARPLGMADEEFAGLRLAASAVESGRPRDVEAVVAGKVKGALGELDSVSGAARWCAALGRVDTAFELLDYYYFDRGRFGSGSPRPLGPLDRRYTSSLFSQPAAPLRADPRFTLLTKATGLEDYWRSAGSPPDYRRSIA